MKLFINVLFLILLTISVRSQNFPDSQTVGKYYEIKGAKIWTVSFGKGDPLFLIAGGPGNAHYYLRSFDSLSTTNTLFTLMHLDVVNPIPLKM